MQLCDAFFKLSVFCCFSSFQKTSRGFWLSLKYFLLFFEEETWKKERYLYFYMILPHFIIQASSIFYQVVKSSLDFFFSFLILSLKMLRNILQNSQKLSETLVYISICFALQIVEFLNKHRFLPNIQMLLRIMTAYFL